MCPAIMNDRLNKKVTTYIANPYQRPGGTHQYVKRREEEA